MSYPLPRPYEDDAWRVDTHDDKIAHYWGSDLDGRPKCEAGLMYGGSRFVEASDATCSVCETWFYRNVTGDWQVQVG